MEAEGTNRVTEFETECVTGCVTECDSWHVQEEETRKVSLTMRNVLTPNILASPHCTALQHHFHILNNVIGSYRLSRYLSSDR